MRWCLQMDYAVPLFVVGVVATAFGQWGTDYLVQKVMNLCVYLSDWPLWFCHLKTAVRMFHYGKGVHVPSAARGEGWGQSKSSARFSLRPSRAL